ncbi:MAG TPA: hypothetical protein VGC41_10885 [Kofleriaceae bacterium]
MEKPDHLDKPVANLWFAQHALGTIALALGILAFIVVAVSQEKMWATPDWRISVPGFVLVAAAAIWAVIRKEHSSTLWLIGLGLAASSLVLGWVLMLAIVLGATALLILIFHSVL